MNLNLQCKNRSIRNSASAHWLWLFFFPLKLSPNAGTKFLSCGGKFSIPALWESSLWFAGFNCYGSEYSMRITVFWSPANACILLSCTQSACETDGHKNMKMNQEKWLVMTTDFWDVKNAFMNTTLLMGWTKNFMPILHANWSTPMRFIEGQIFKNNTLNHHIFWNSWTWSYQPDFGNYVHLQSQKLITRTRFQFMSQVTYPRLKWITKP